MWDAAVWRAGGDPKRVVVRATSLGTVATGFLLAAGAEPASVVLIAPVLPDSVVPRFARTFYGRPAEMLAGIFAPVAELDLVGAVRGAHTRIVAISSADETLIDLEERIRLHDAVVASGGSWFEHDNGHFFVAAEAHSVLAEEERLLTSLHIPPLEARVNALVRAIPADVVRCFPKGSEERARFEELARFASARDVRLAAAAALAFQDVSEAQRIVRSPPREAAWMSVDDLALTFALDDPCGPLPFQVLECVCRRQRLDSSAFHAIRNPPNIAHEALNAGEGWGDGFVLDLPLGRSVELWNEDCDVWPLVARTDLDVADDRRRFARILLKAEGLPDRVRRAADGRWRLEYRQFEKWLSLDLDRPSYDNREWMAELEASRQR
jgi:hypothetical protein